MSNIIIPEKFDLNLQMDQRVSEAISNISSSSSIPLIVFIKFTDNQYFKWDSVVSTGWGHFDYFLVDNVIEPSAYVVALLIKQYNIFPIIKEFYMFPIDDETDEEKDIRLLKYLNGEIDENVTMRIRKCNSFEVSNYRYKPDVEIGYGSIYILVKDYGDDPVGGPDYIFVYHALAA